MTVKPVPEGYSTLTPYLISNGADTVIDFLEKVFDAKTEISMRLPDGSIGHAEVTIGDSKLMISEANESCKASKATLYVYLPNVDEVYQKALAAGGENVAEPADQFYGDRHGGVKDPAGNTWWISTHIEDVPPEEMETRKEEWMKKHKQ